MAARRRRRTSRRRSSLGSNIDAMTRPMMGMVAVGGAAIIGAGVLSGIGSMFKN